MMDSGVDKYHIPPLSKESLANIDIELNETLEFKDRLFDVIEQINNRYAIIIETHAKPTGEYGFLHSCHILLDWNLYGMLAFPDGGFEPIRENLEYEIKADYHYSRSQQLVRGIHLLIDIIPKIKEKLNER